MKITPAIAKAAITKLSLLESMSHDELLEQCLMDDCTASICVNPDCKEIHAHRELGSSGDTCPTCGTPTVYGIDVLTDIAS